MRIRTLFLYLIGNRQAILEVAADRRYLVIGFLFVSSAAFAREYDGEDLLHQPWHLLLPFAASVAGCAVLFGMIRGALALDDDPPHKHPLTCLSLLRLFWMTAPLAWLYAIPVERFMNPLDATKANLCLLGVVSAWRVCLTIRVVSVLLGGGWLAATFFVLLFASGLVVILSLFGALTAIGSSMAGVRLTDSEKLIRDTIGIVGNIAFCSLPVCFVGWCFTIKDQTGPWLKPLFEAAGRRSSDWRVFAIAVVSVAAWVPALLVTQPEQRLKHQAEQLVLQKRAAEALALMSAHSREDFPPHWKPPPKFTGWVVPSLLDILERVADSSPAPWVRALYVRRLRDCLSEPVDYRWMEDHEFLRLIELLRRLPEGPELTHVMHVSLQNLRGTEHEGHAVATLERIERVRKILERERSQ